MVTNIVAVYFHSGRLSYPLGGGNILAVPPLCVCFPIPEFVILPMSKSKNSDDDGKKYIYSSVRLKTPSTCPRPTFLTALSYHPNLISHGTKYKTVVLVSLFKTLQDYQ